MNKQWILKVSIALLVIRKQNYAMRLSSRNGNSFKLNLSEAFSLLSERRTALCHSTLHPQKGTRLKKLEDDATLPMFLPMPIDARTPILASWVIQSSWLSNLYIYIYIYIYIYTYTNTANFSSIDGYTNQQKTNKKVDDSILCQNKSAMTTSVFTQTSGLTMIRLTLTQAISKSRGHVNVFSLDSFLQSYLARIHVNCLHESIALGFEEGNI